MSELSQVEPITTLVLGFGNPLWGDDGAGIEAVNMLAENEIPDGVRVEPAGLPGFGLAAWLGEACLSSLQRLVLVDAAHMGQAPGVWRPPRSLPRRRPGAVPPAASCGSGRLPEGTARSPGEGATAAEGPRG